jgi:hypothetical protein
LYHWHHTKNGNSTGNYRDHFKTNHRKYWDSANSLDDAVLNPDKPKKATNERNLDAYYKLVCIPSPITQCLC